MIARLLPAIAVIAAAAPAAAESPYPLRVVVATTVVIDEDRVYVTDEVDVRPTSGEPVQLAEADRRFVLPEGVGEGSRAAVQRPGFGAVDLKIQDRAVVIPADVPAAGLRLGFDYSLPAPDEEASWAIAYPLAIDEVRVSAQGQAGGFRVAISGGQSSREAAKSGLRWIARASRGTRAGASEPITISLSGMRTYHPPAHISLAVTLSALIALAGLWLGFRNHSGRR